MHGYSIYTSNARAQVEANRDVHRRGDPTAESLANQGNIPLVKLTSDCVHARPVASSPTRRTDRGSASQGARPDTRYRMSSKGFTVTCCTPPTMGLARAGEQV